MELKKKHLALLIAAFIGLSGCVEDAKDSDGSGNSGEVTPPDGGDNGGGDNGGGDNGGDGDDLKLPREVTLYYKADDKEDSPYGMYLYDKNGDALAIGNDNSVTHSNITMTGETSVKDPLTVTVSEDKASIVFSSEDKAYDLNTANGNDNLNGTLQFKVITNSFDVINGDDVENTVTLNMASGDNKASVDVTSAVSASIGATQPQLIRVPLRCFQEQENGIDISKVDVAMTLESIGPIEYQFSDARIIANSVPEQSGSNNVQGCLNNNNSQVIVGESSVITESIKTDAGWVEQGLATEILRTRGQSVNPTPNGNENGATRYVGIGYDSTAETGAFDPTKRSVLTFSIDKAANLKDMKKERLDISRYMGGTLQMKFFMPAASIDLPQGDDTFLVLQFDTPDSKTTDVAPGGYPQSELISYSLNQANYEKGKVLDIEIPIKDFFTKADTGAVSLNGIQYVQKLVTHIQQTDSEGNADYSQLDKFRYGLADIKLVMPTDEPEVPEVPEPEAPAE